MDQPHAATAMIEDSPTAWAFLSVRTCPEAGTSGTYWDESVLECALARDMILASGGVPAESSGLALVARFRTVQSAAMAARRLQWSAQGFSDSAQSQALSVLIQAGEDMARGDNDAQLLEQAPGGRILVAEAAVRALEEIPGFVLKPAEENTPVRDLAWRAEESQTTRAADEQVVARFIELSGRTEYAAAAEAQIAAQPASEPEPWTTTEPERKSRTMLWVGLAAVALIAIAAAFFFLRPKPEVKKVAVVEQPTTSSGTQTSSSDKSTSGTPAGATSQAATNASGEGPAAPLTKAQKRELERQQKKAQQAAVAKPAKESTPQPQTETQPPVQESKQTKVSGNCLYSSDLLPGLIARAENSRGRRQYKEARRMLQAVLACEPGNVKAKEELELVRQDEDTEGSSDPQ